LIVQTFKTLTETAFDTCIQFPCSQKHYIFKRIKLSTLLELLL